MSKVGKFLILTHDVHPANNDLIFAEDKNHYYGLKCGGGWWIVSKTAQNFKLYSLKQWRKLWHLKKEKVI